jgi:Cysteine rich repeat
MHRLTVAAALVLLMSGAPALAQSDANTRSGGQPAATTTKVKASKGTKDQQNACFRDANRYCSDDIPEGDMKVLACLKDHRSKLSKACQKVLEENGQ